MAYGHRPGARGTAIALEPLPQSAARGQGAPHYNPVRFSPREQLALRRDGERFALAYGETPDVAAGGRRPGYGPIFWGRWLIGWRSIARSRPGVMPARGVSCASAPA